MYYEKIDNYIDLLFSQKNKWYVVKWSWFEREAILLMLLRDISKSLRELSNRKNDFE